MSDEAETPDQIQVEQTTPVAGAPKAAAKKKSAAGALTFKVSAKGAVSVYGLGRFPVTLYNEQWRRLLGSIPALETFLEENKSQLKVKDASGEGSGSSESESSANQAE